MTDFHQVPVFVVDSSGFIQVFRTVEIADSAMELLESWSKPGDNPEIYCLDGRQLVVVGDTATDFTVSDRADLAQLVGHLVRARSRHFFSSDPNDLKAVANELFVRQWADRWPKWPRWLSSRLHGEKPFQVH